MSARGVPGRVAFVMVVLAGMLPMEARAQSPQRSGLA